MSGELGPNFGPWMYSCNRDGEIAQLGKVLGEMGVNPVTAITFGCATIHFPTVYNLQCHQRPGPLATQYGVGG